MDIQTKIRYNYKQNLYYIEVKDPQTETTVVNPRMYERESEAKLAEAIILFMFSGYSSRAEFDLDKFNFYVRAVFHLLNAEGKW